MDASRTALKNAARVTGLGLVVLMYVGAVLAGTGRRSGVFMVLGAVLVMMAMHLVVGVIGYRKVMRRPWPRVEPLEDDDDDW